MLSLSNNVSLNECMAKDTTVIPIVFIKKLSGFPDKIEASSRSP